MLNVIAGVALFVVGPLGLVAALCCGYVDRKAIVAERRAEQRTS